MPEMKTKTRALMRASALDDWQNRGKVYLRDPNLGAIADLCWIETSALVTSKGLSRWVITPKIN
jgi:hypothetical protein